MSFYPNSNHVVSESPSVEGGAAVAIRPLIGQDPKPPLYTNSAHENSGYPPPGAPPGGGSPDGRVSDGSPAESEPAPLQVPENVAKLREGRYQMFDPAVTFKNEIDFGNAEVDPATMAPVNSELRRMAADVGLSSPEIVNLVAMGRGFERQAPTDEQKAEWGRELNSNLQRQYGAEAHEMLQLGKALLARDPRLHSILTQTHLASHPGVMALLIDKARAERRAGRL